MLGFLSCRGSLGWCFNPGVEDGLFCVMDGLVDTSPDDRVCGVDGNTLTLLFVANRIHVACEYKLHDLYMACFLFRKAKRDLPFSESL